ncbi:MAG: hypothetical protein ACLFTE_09850 [Salinivenus sp.]
MSDRPASSTESEAPNAEASEDENVQRLSIDEFDPWGTLAVTGSYFLLLLVLYALMYFVEFAGRGASIIH